MAVPILWRNRRQRYNLEGEVCAACARTVFPPREVCPYCSREHRERERLETAVQPAGMHRNRYNNEESERDQLLESLWVLPDMEWESSTSEERNREKIAIHVRVAGDD